MIYWNIRLIISYNIAVTLYYLFYFNLTLDGMPATPGQQPSPENFLNRTLFLNWFIFTGFIYNILFRRSYLWNGDIKIVTEFYRETSFKLSEVYIVRFYSALHYFILSLFKYSFTISIIRDVNVNADGWTTTTTKNDRPTVSRRKWSIFWCLLTEMYITNFDSGMNNMY